MKNLCKRSALLLGLVILVTPTLADTAPEVYKTIGIKPAQVLNGTVLTAQVVPGPDKQVVALTTYFTGSKDKEDAVNVRLDVFTRRQGQLFTLYTRDYGDERAGGVGYGELQAIDLDRDRVNEIVVSFESFDDPLVEQRIGEVIVYGPAGFETVWSGPMKYDATREARRVPPERRDRYEREIDIAATLGSRGRTIYFTKEVIAIAGERLPEPKFVQEGFPLKSGSY